MNDPRLRRVALLASVLLATAPVASAQRTTFEPSISLLWGYTDNVNIVDSAAEPSTAQDAADSYGTLRLGLPVTYAAAFGSIGLSYYGDLSRYRTNTQYDNLAHVGTITFNPRLNDRDTLSFAFLYSRSQEQRTPNEIDKDDQFLTTRTERTFLETQLRYHRDARRSFWDVVLRGYRSEFEPIADSESPPPDSASLAPENRDYLRSSIEYQWRFSRRFSLGPRYDFGYSELERNGTESIHGLGLAFGWAVSRYFSFEAVASGFQRNADNPNTEPASTQETGFAWTLDLRLDPPLAAIQNGKIKLGLNIGIAPTGGGALEGTSTDSFVRLYLSSGVTRSRWSWLAGTRYTRRDATLDSFDTYQTVGLGGFVSYGLGGLLSLRLATDWTEQVDTGSSVSNASFREVQLGLVLYPLGKSRDGQR